MVLIKSTRRAPRTLLPVLGGPVLPSFTDVENRMRRFFEGEDLFNGESMPASALGWMPAMDISETPDQLVLTAELPGLDRKDLDVSIDDGVLVIRGEKLEERKEGEDGKKYYLSERSYGVFERSFALPRNVDGGKIDAEFSKGILTVRMPKTAEAKSKGRKIEIAG